jgi:hypothetical protein
MKDYDLIVVGGGAAGIMAAISAKRHHPQMSVALLDRTFALGRKILVCGAGRCNITNINLSKEITKRYYGAEIGFITGVFDQFGYQDIVDFFAELGVELYVERKTNIGKLFPVTDQAKTITSMLEDELKRLDITVFLNCEVTSIRHDKQFSLDCTDISTADHTKTQFTSKYLILSAGGKTYPALGANGSGYLLATQLGHRIIEPVPSALPLEGKSQLSHLVQGTKMELGVTSYIDDQPIKSSTDDVMFTQYGLSGPAILNISREISIAINRYRNFNTKVKLNFFPEQTATEVRYLLQQRWTRRPQQTVENSLFGLFPNKIASALVEIAGISKDLPVNKLTDVEIDRLIAHLTSYEIKITNTRGWNEAEFTAGGVDTTEIVDRRLASKLIPNLYLCGEILNVDGDVGGFNLSWAWCSGFVAGKLS